MRGSIQRYLKSKRDALSSADCAQQIVGRERRGRVSQLAWCGAGCFDSRRRVNSTVRCFSLTRMEQPSRPILILPLCFIGTVGGIFTAWITRYEYDALNRLFLRRG